MSDTPRTDIEERIEGDTGPLIVDSSFARELERELNEQVLCNGKGGEREAGLLVKVDRLERENALFRNETLICADCDAVRKADYDSVMASLKAVRELCTTNHESKEQFIARVLLCLA
jgi:hypothetical protein